LFISTTIVYSQKRHFPMMDEASAVLVMAGVLSKQM
jgi:hypothetical protein